MACFLTPLTLGLAVSLIRRLFKTSNKGKLHLLEVMLLGGSLILMIEHVWHGELAPYPPFLTAMSNPEEYATLINEVTARGSVMAITVTSVWALVVNSNRLLVKLKTLKTTTVISKR